MPDKTQAFDDLLTTFQKELDSRLTPDGTVEFVKIYKESIGPYLDCDKVNGDTRDFWTVDKFRNWALRSTGKLANRVDVLTKKYPAQATHIREAANQVFREMTNDPDEHCNDKKQVPRCVGMPPADPGFGPVCELYFRRGPAAESQTAEQPA